jgi:hypothetical protein
VDRTEIVEALQDLGNRLNTPVEITLAGGCALILVHGLTRVTADLDTIDSRPPIDSVFRMAIEQTACHRDLPTSWLNDGVKGFIDVLPPGFRQRRVLFGTYGSLVVYVLGRKDLILMKFYAMRAEDLQDLRELAPTSEEIAFVRNSLDHVARTRPDKALTIQLYLDQGESRSV